MAGKIDTTPGARNVVASLQGTQAVMPLYSVDFSRAVQAVQQEIQIVSGRLDDILLRNVFSVPPDELLKGMTATAVVARRRAALQKMGPAINRYESRILSGVIERTYGVLASMGLIPEPPFPEAASPLQISYQSPLAEGLKQSGSDSITAFLQIAQPIIQAVPDCADKVDFDQVLDICARSLAAFSMGTPRSQPSKPPHTSTAVAPGAHTAKRQPSAPFGSVQGCAPRMR